MDPLRTLCSRFVLLPVENIDTDQIIPARFLKGTTKTDLGRHLFADWRYDGDGRPREGSPFDKESVRGARVLVAGHNFGCGSSREHAAWALADFGIRAVLSTGIADIFRTNAIKNGIVPVVVSEAFYARTIEDRGAYVTIDVVEQTVALTCGTVATFPLDPFARHCLVNGVDELGVLLGREEAIAKFEKERGECAR
jgi:3-isopropylmalate/(R)-2-methylmalate dehydratase small subunit